jgi:hypothetical protein
MADLTTEPSMRQLLVVAGLFLLAACAGEPSPTADQAAPGGLPQWLTGFPDAGPSFAIATLGEEPTQPGYAGFNKAGPLLAATHADQICTLGYQRVAEETAPGEQVPLTVTRVRCSAYRPSF